MRSHRLEPWQHGFPEKRCLQLINLLPHLLPPCETRVRWMGRRRGRRALWELFGHSQPVIHYIYLAFASPPQHQSKWSLILAWALGTHCLFHICGSGPLRWLSGGWPINNNHQILAHRCGAGGAGRGREVEVSLVRLKIRSWWGSVACVADITHPDLFLILPHMWHSSMIWFAGGEKVQERQKSVLTVKELKKLWSSTEPRFLHCIWLSLMMLMCCLSLGLYRGF